MRVGISCQALATAAGFIIYAQLHTLTVAKTIANEAAHLTPDSWIN